MAQLCKSLKSLSERIVKLHTNIKKDSKSRYTQGYLRTRLETLESYWSKYQEQHDATLSAVPSSDLEKLDYDVNSLYEETEDVYLEFKGLLKDYLLEFTKAQTQPQSNSSTQSFTTASDCEYTTIRTKLPSLSIPKFSGDYNEWTSFKDLYKALIHDNKHITAIEKHHYLKTSLSGEAEQLLKHFALTEANYEKAWNTLESRYDNKRMIVTTIISRLFNQKKISIECSRSLKEILDTTKECLNSLDNLGVNTATWDAIVVHLVVSKLDLDTHKQWEQSLGSSQDIPTFTLLLSFLENRFRAIEMVNVTHKSDPSQKNHLFKNTTPHKPTNMKSFVTEVSSECTYCSQNHYICHCKDFTLLDVPQRQDFIKKNGICFNCLVKGHSVNACRQSTTCKKCNRRHHTLLHFTSPNKSTSEPEHNLPAPSLPESSQYTPTVVAMADIQSTQVILATAQIAVQSRNNETIVLRALIDQASQASFITEAAAQLLDLERTAVSGKITGISYATVTTKSMVNLKFHAVKDSTYTFTAEAHVLERLTSELPTQEFPVDTWPSFELTELADPHFHKPGSIDVLLGADVHAHIILDGLRRHDSLIAMNSRLGWLVSGRVTKQPGSHSHSELVMHTQIEVDQLVDKSMAYTPTAKHLPRDETHCKEQFKPIHTHITSEDENAPIFDESLECLSQHKPVSRRV